MVETPKVGILFFLFEFFSDQLLAFMVLSVVWLCEVYSVVSVRTSVCIRFFPQVRCRDRLGWSNFGRLVPRVSLPPVYYFDLVFVYVYTKLVQFFFFFLSCCSCVVFWFRLRVTSR